MNASVNLTLEGTTAVLLILTAAPFFSRSRTMSAWPRKLIYLTIAIAFHFLAICRKLASNIAVVMSVGEEDIIASGTFALILIAASVLALSLCILCDEDGKLRMRDRSKAVSILQLLEAILPTALAVPFLLPLGGAELLCFTYAVSLHLIAMTMQNDERQELRTREAQLDVQQARLLTEQMQPHFIFNSLSTIEALCVIDPEAAAKCVDDFAGYLRGNIDAMTSEDPIPFGKELEHIGQYVALERADPGRQFEIVYELETKDFLLPGLTVQPIVENAIKHGALTRLDGSGRVLLRTEEVGDLIRIVVEDNGLGESEEEKRAGHVKVGMKNVEYRLSRQCGGTFHFHTGKDGARAVITIPKNWNG